MEYKFTQQLTQEDYVEFVYTHAIAGMFTPFKKTLLVLSIAYLVLSPFFLGGSLTFMYIGIGVVIFLFMFLKLIKNNASRYYDRIKDSLKTENIVSDEGFHYEATEGTFDRMWSEFYSARETDIMIYIYVSKKAAIPVKKDVAGEEVITFIKQKLLDNAKNVTKFRFTTKNS
ncbi:hypothetical protein CI105_04750 [Candidatus Izimaplasma bacterium ZiA1]|uniref:YcxB family protein n=1 Tax=Candidatus Izimoplasma sp. ZiA1 TaxID=2024899 RepID=UPI000BAA70F5|nr:hypothetical protein CI105_04750 [Candidatus Izimaplasma bacterium ZiA1]